MPTDDNFQSCVPDMERIVKDYGTQLLRMCFMYLKDMQHAEDAVQETFIKVYRSYSSFNGKSSEKTWVIRIAINVCKDILRSAWNNRVDVSDELADIPYEENFNSDDSLIKEIMKLKPKYKEVILLFYYQDIKTADIAKILNCPIATVGVRLKRAREILKNTLGGETDE